jgi:hypothetical protein
MKALIILALLCSPVAHKCHHHKPKDAYDFALRREALIHDFGDVIIAYYGVGR